MKVTVNSVEETNALAQKIASQLNGSEIILLEGDLGAGKTTFTKALALALDIDDIVTSPTFAFMKEYCGKYRLSHYDMYRAESEDELFELGIADNLSEPGVCVIEWNKYTVFPDGKMIISITIRKIGEEAREFIIEGMNALSEEL